MKFIVLFKVLKYMDVFIRVLACFALYIYIYAYGEQNSFSVSSTC